ncbi:MULTISPECIES: YrhB domain-containing protein [unclassified Paraburkholderia]|uniref:YrhB domain-containing protein n=1 Tax=unclassified Paraburkholderia TaxID=2615204 RepID=UPI002AB12956|nr:MULTISPECIES: YrhB domain-containing protein [unclassified Paraburkholderia]
MMTITKDQALHIVQNYLDEEISSGSEKKYVVMDDKTIEKSYGWVFIFNSKKYLETGNMLYALGGNGPIVVEKETGKIHQLGTALSLQNSIKQFETANGF